MLLGAKEPVGSGLGRKYGLVMQMRDQRAMYADSVEDESGLRFEPLQRESSVSTVDDMSGLECLAEEIGEAIGQHDKELQSLRDDIAQLRAEIDVERRVKAAEIIDLPDWRRRA
jgi:hypothetical protein